MTKIKLSLPSGSEVEKTVLSYFNNGGNYLVLDAESVGSMGLPIILVSKVSDKAEKIVDQTEWQQVKGYLKNIISGGQTTYLAIPETISADETYYTQLTLPVASFDALKNNYAAPAAAPAESAPAPAAPAEVAPVEPVAPVENPAPEVTPVVAEAPAADTPAVPEITDIPAPEEAPAATPAPEASTDLPPVNMTTDIVEETPVIETPAVPAVEESVPTVDPIAAEPIAAEGLNASNDAPAVADAPVVDSVPVIATDPVAEAPLPTIEEAPTVDTPAPAPSAPAEVAPVETVATGSADINEIKQKFMSACEELFESLAALNK
jgi:hypothetical protein